MAARQIVPQIVLPLAAPLAIHLYNSSCPIEDEGVLRLVA